jgi:hypothetical protein
MPVLATQEDFGSRPAWAKSSEKLSMVAHACHPSSTGKIKNRRIRAQTKNKTLAQ